MKEFEYKTEDNGKPIILLLPDQFFNLLRSDKEELSRVYGIHP